MVHLHKEFYGKGPTGVKTYFNEETVLVLMHGGFTKVEETLLAEGRGQAVADQRHQFQKAMAARFTEVIEEETGRKVVAFMSTSNQDPDLLAEVFVLDTNDITAPGQVGPPEGGLPPDQRS